LYEPSCARTDDFLCRILRGEVPAWPAAYDRNFAPSFLRQSLHHGVQALVFDHAHGTPQWDGWPDEVKAGLAAALRGGVAFDLLRAHEVAQFLQELRRRGIAFLLTKGAALARTHYTNSALRTRCDTDLFIDLHDIERVRLALLESGYEVVPPVYKSHQFMGVSRHHTEAPVIFDIHWRILNAPQFARVIDFTGALDRSVPVPGMDGCRTLAAVDALLLACMHRKGSVQHDEDRLIWLYDIHLLLGAMTPGQLAEFAGRAVHKKVQAACLDGLRRVQACFHTVVADAVIDVLKAVEPANRSGRFAASNLSLLLDDLRRLPGMQTRWSLIGELFFPSADSLTRKYPASKPRWLPLLYLRHILGGLSARLTLR
jgi:hypothetical protein